jgi:hypothetical protein
MDTRDLWEEQVQRLTNQCRLMVEQITSFDERLTFMENTMLTLIVALRDGGVIVDSDEGEHQF